MIRLDPKYHPLLLEAIEDYLYRLSLQLAEMKGGPLTADRKALTHKQKMLEELHKQLSSAENT